MSDEMRALDARVARAMGWTESEEGHWHEPGRDRPSYVPPWLTTNPFHLTYLKRHIEGRGWEWSVTWNASGSFHARVGKLYYRVAASEGHALALAFLAAVEGES